MKQELTVNICRSAPAPSTPPAWHATFPLKTVGPPPADTAPEDAAGTRIRELDGLRLHAPMKGSGPDVLVVLLQGAGLRPQAYDKMARALQAASGERLWVAVPRFPFDMPLPLTGNEARVRESIERVQKETGVSFPANRVFIAGHSAGGVVAGEVAQRMDCGGVVLLGAYLAHGLGGAPEAPAYPRPVLTVGGELDGLTRLTRVAESWKESQGVKDAAVVVLPSVNHAAFADGRVLSGDLPGEAPLASEQAAIAASVADFLTAHADDAVPVADRQAAQARLDAAVSSSAPMVVPFLEAEAGRAAWVTEAVRASMGAASLPADRFEVRPSDKGNAVSLAFSRPQLHTEPDGRLVLDAPYLAAAPCNPLDVSTTRVAPDSLAIKMKSPAAVERALGGPAGAAPAAAADLNRAALGQALAAVTPAQRERFLVHGRMPTVLPDRPVGSGPAWLVSSVLDRSAATLQSSVLDTPSDAKLGPADMHYVKVLPPDAAIEWVLVDGLREA